MKIGFIGLGIMGSRMAANLQKAGHELTVFNRSIDKAQTLVSEGAKLAESIEALSRDVEVLFTMLSTPKVVEEAAAEFLPNLSKDATWVDCSTVNPSFSQKMGALAKTHGIQFLDAPVAGSKGPAETGELLFLAGGNEEDFKSLNPLFDAMGKKTLYLNEIGNGANVKMLINLMLAQSMATFSEAMSLGHAMGLDEEQLLNIMTATPVVSPVMGVLKERLLTRTFDTNFPLKWIHKDINLALDTAKELDVNMISLTQTEKLFHQAIEQGFGEEDFSAIYKAL